MTDLIKCNKCGHILVTGEGCQIFIGKGSIIGCKKYEMDQR